MRYLLYNLLLCFCGATILDAHNRTVIYHGINYVTKAFPYYPIISDNEFQHLYNMGFNAIRLGYSWRGLEPDRNHYNMSYITQLYNIVQRAKLYNISIIIDNHQDAISPLFCGNGFPNFIKPKPNIKAYPEPLENAIPINNITELPEWCAHYNWQYNYATYAVSNAFQNLYDNYDGYLDSFIKQWALIASVFNNCTNIIGYEIINEPWMGDMYNYPEVLEPGYTENYLLQPLYLRVTQAIRQYDTLHYIMYEPVTWDYFSSGFTQLPKNQIFAYHIYCLDIKANMSYIDWLICNESIHTMHNARMQDIIRLQLNGFMTEFGYVSTDTDQLQVLSNILNLSNKWQQSWTYYGPITKYHETLLDYPYPKIIAGNLIFYGYVGTKYHIEFNNTWDISTIYILVHIRYLLCILKYPIQLWDDICILRRILMY